MRTPERPTPKRTNNVLLPTLLDRLKDDAPQRQSEAAHEYSVTRAQLRDIIQRDLAYLLNTTNASRSIDRSLHPEAASSVINFGLPPISGGYQSGRKWADLRGLILQAIQDFEPRIEASSLQVEPIRDAGQDPRYNVLPFEIRGRILMEPYPLEFLVQSSIDLESNRMILSPAHPR